MQAPIISIIIPVYKTEKYLHECLDSVIAQTFTNWEAILVDDGSPDNSGKICDEYAKNDSRFKVIHQENGGVSAARLNGFKHSIGEWFFFLDSDDTLTVDSLQVLISNTQGQLCICGNSNEIRNDIEQHKIYTHDNIFTKEEIFGSIIKFERKYSWELWGKLIHRSLLSSDILQINNNIKVFEDYIITLRYLKKVRTIKYINKPVYNYILRVGSATNRNLFNLEKIELLDKYISKECDAAEFKEARIKGKFQMLSWIIGDNKLNRNTVWFKELYKESKEIKLNRTETLLAMLVKCFNSGGIRKAIWNLFLLTRK